jgi:hypothetical protein
MSLSPDDHSDLQDAELKYVPITPEQAARALLEVASCESCTPDSPWLIPFDWLLRDVSAQKGYMDYILPAPVACPRCAGEITEKTLVEPQGGLESPALALQSTR